MSPEIAPVLEKLGVWNRFLDAQPSIMRRLVLHFHSIEKRCNLPEPAYGLSRYRFDHLLFEEALRLGAQLASEDSPDSSASAPLVIAHGRKTASPKGRRLFGFKSHFEGPANDAVELFFFNGCYVGVNPVENGITNVCGLGPETFLRAHDFELDGVVNSFPPLAERLRPLSRRMKWLTVGPLVYRNSFKDAVAEGHYPAGDALSFVDPFTGSGLLAAATTGRLAGIASARGTTSREYLEECRRCLEKPFHVSSFFRSMIANGWAEPLLPLVPGSWLVKLTRPRVA